MNVFAYRRNVERVAFFVCVAGTLMAVVPLVLVLATVVERGLPHLSLAFLTQMPRPVGEQGGGMGNALLGTLLVVGLGCLFGVPVGMLAGVYVVEFGGGRLARAVRSSISALAGVPSIVIGFFVYALVVAHTKHFSAVAGGLALGILIIPTVAQTTMELLRLVPETLREAALALGVPKWKTIVFVVLRTAARGVATGVLLSVARVTGETAPLLFTALNSRFVPNSLSEPVATLPVQIYAYAGSPYEEWHAQAWSGALTLVVLVLVLNLAARLLFRAARKKVWHRT